MLKHRLSFPINKRRSEASMDQMGLFISNTFDIALCTAIYNNIISTMYIVYYNYTHYISEVPYIAISDRFAHNKGQYLTCVCISRHTKHPETRNNHVVTL